MAPATAAAAPELTVSPLRIDREVDPGSTTLVDITLGNTGDEPYTVVFEHVDFGFANEGYELVFVDDEAPETVDFSTRGMFSTPGADEWTVQPGQQTSVDLQIDVPEGTPGGTLLGAALFRMVPPDQEGAGAPVTATARAGPLVFLNVDGGSPAEVVIRDIDVPRRVGSAPVRATVTVGNDGESYAQGMVTFRLTGPGDTDVQLEAAEGAVVPGTDRQYEFTVEPDDGLGIGRYKATATFTPLQGGDGVSEDAAVWVMPTWLLAVLCLTVIILLALIARGVWMWWSTRQLTLEEIAAELDDEDDPESTGRLGQ